MSVNTKLNLNKHPKDNDNLSLVNAQAVKISHDGSCITSEDSIKENSFIHNYLSAFYGTNPVIGYKIVGIIPCNNELVIVVKPSNTVDDADIFRYQEPINDNIEKMYCAYGGLGSPNRFKYQGGLIKGAFTYNVENSLVIAISEYGNSNIRIPLRTINLGNSDDPTVYNDKDLSNSKLYISPEVRLPSVNNLDYTAGSAYKGWYYMFIRYKINSVDYTQWYSIGPPIYIDTLEQYQIIRYPFGRDTKFAASALNDIVSPAWPDDGYGAGASDYFSNSSDIAKETFKVDLYFNKNIDYTKYQIGVICASKSYTKAFRTADIYLDKNYNEGFNVRIQKYVLDNKSLIEYNVSSFITDNGNYFNSKNVINYKNRLYISNYLEDNANNDDIPQSIIDSINVNLYTSYVRDYGLVYDTALIVNWVTGANQYDTYKFTEIPLARFLNISEETIVTISASGHTTKISKAGQFYITSGNSVPGYAYIQLREPGPLGSVSVTNYGVQPYSDYIYLAIADVNNNPQSNFTFDPVRSAINGGMMYTNTNIDFDSRKKQSCLIPGEVYNFNIHFTNKYSGATNGYRIPNNTKWIVNGEPNREIIPISFNLRVNSETVTYYAAMDVDSNVAREDFTVNERYSINVNGIRFFKQYNTFGTSPTLSSEVTSPSDLQSCVAAFKEFFSSYNSDKFSTTKWYQVSYGPGGDKFHLFINNNGDRLFKIPTIESFTGAWDGFPDEVAPFKQYNLHTLMRASFDNIEIPEGYDGFYISYEKFESQARATGLLTRNDFRTQDWIVKGGNTVQLGTRNSAKSDKMFFYSSTYDISDTIKLDYSIMRIEAINPFKKEDIPEWDYFQRNNTFNFLHDMNKPQVASYFEDVQRTYAMPEYKIAVADSVADDRMGVGTALQIKDSYNLFASYVTSAGIHDRLKVYRVTLLNTTRDIYMSDSKTLIRLGDVVYRSEGAPTNYKYSQYINSGYNGHYTYDGIPIYENAGVVFNTANNRVFRINNHDHYYKFEVPNDKPHTYQNDVPFLAYLQLPICTDVFFESKSYKNSPVGFMSLVKGSDENSNKFAKGTMVTPVNSIDLFENRQGSADQFNPKTYVNFREDLVSVEQFDKTIRRSNVIQNESRVNGWRTFPIEGYKNITENKGKITNIIGIGTVLLAHTEHSMFMFDTDNTLKTEGKDIQLLQPDAFEVSYNEVFTSDKGFGGLQDDKSYIVNDFGYIFYSDDTNRIYRFDDKQLDNMDEDIIQWLKKYKPFNVRMANDKENNRILMKFDYLVTGLTRSTVISYNYNEKNFVSQHPYYFDEAFNTKVGLYLQCTNDHNGCSLHNFDYKGDVYGRYDNIKGTLGQSIVAHSKLSFIINDSYSIVKFLEYITYKLTKYAEYSGTDFTNLPVEEYKTPYAGYTLAVYNNNVNTGVLNITTDIEANKNMFDVIDKPYWDLGVWNFSYLRNRISELNNGVSDDNITRLFGNYFIVEFVFDNEDGRKIDFEELNYNVSE